MFVPALNNETPSYHSRLLAIIFFIAIIFLIIIGLLIILPSAEITIIANREPLVEDLSIKIDQSLKVPLDNLDTIPGTIYDSSQPPVMPIDQKKYYIMNATAEPSRTLVIAFLRQDLDKILDFKLNGSTEITKSKLNQGAEITAYKINSLNPDLGQATAVLSLKTEVVPNYNLDAISNSLVNQTTTEAMKYLRSLSGVKDVKIKQNLSFGSRLPMVGKRIKIRLDII